ncbi:O-antigen ligase family protein [Terrabacter sp. Ter38]|uniref:O-antigen ligase family protein n=1 Tax=Terrabacter sp. Ter38 TaxID=2926030 RepID=UPI00211941C5|nr:O-antigen ligase family protein [Terrabacter sp. Ter38]
MRIFLTRLTAASLAFYLLFGQRLTVAASTGGRGAVSLPEMMFLGLSALLWFTLKIRVDGPQAKGLFLSTVGPLFTLLVLLPFIGVLVGDYELRALYGFVVVLVPVSILVLGTAASRWQVDLRGPVFIAVVGQGVYGLGQLLARVGVMPAGLWSSALNWDAETQAAYSESYVISSRSTGLFVNPNEFGLWSVLAVIFGALYLQGRRRAIAIGLGTIGVFASQSRTAWLAFALLLLTMMVANLLRPRTAKLSLVAMALAAVTAGLVALFGGFSRLVEAGAVNRFNSGLGVLTGAGASEDANLSGRYVGWERANDFVKDYVFGTLGPPQLKFGGSIDNQFVSYYLQGGLLLVCAYVLALASPFIVLPRAIHQAWKLMLVAAALAIFSYTASPMDSPAASSLAWVCVILTVQSSLFRGSTLAKNDGAESADPETEPPPGVRIGRQL